MITESSLVFSGDNSGVITSAVHTNAVVQALDSFIDLRTGTVAVVCGDLPLTCAQHETGDDSQCYNDELSGHLVKGVGTMYGLVIYEFFSYFVDCDVYQKVLIID